MQFLIVDDEPSDLELLEVAFAKVSDSQSTLQFSSANSALAELERAVVDGRGDAIIIVTDLKMPRMDGIQFTTELRNRWAPGPLVIGLSTSGRQSDIDAFFRAGGNSYHEKPMGYHGTVELCEQIRSYWSTIELPTMSRRSDEEAI